MKKQIGKRLLSIMLTLALVFTMMPMIPGAVETAHAATDNTIIYVKADSGITTLDETALASDVDKLSTDGWKWDAANKQLQLSGFSGTGIEADGDLNIVLTGTNVITMPNTGADYEYLYGVKSTEGTVTIKGDGAGERDSLTIQQTDIQDCNAYWYGIDAKSYTYAVNIEDCDVKIDFGGKNASYNFGYHGIFGKTYVKGNANVDIDIYNGFAIGISTLYAETTGTIDIKLGDPNTEDEKAVRGQRCVTDLNATGNGTINLSAAGEDGVASKGNLVIGKDAGTITAKGMLTMPRSYIYSTNLFNIADNKAITSLEGTSQYGLSVVDTDNAVLLDNSGKEVTEWKIATVENNPLVFIDSAHLDQAASVIGADWDYTDYMTGLVYGGKKPYAFEATGLPDGITLQNNWPYIRLAGTFTTVSDPGTITITVTDANGATASIDVAYGAVTPKPKNITVGETTFLSNEDKSDSDWSYTAADSKLVLNNYNGGGISADIDLNIVLTGTNTITMPNTGADYEYLYGVKSTEGTVTIKGDGAGERDSLTIQQTDIQDCNAYWYGIDAKSYTYAVNIEDCDVKIDFGGKNASYNFGYHGIFGKTYVKGNANVDIDIDNGFAVGISTLYAETTGTIDIKLGDPNTEDEKAVRGQRCVSDLHATGKGTINLSAAGEDGVASRGDLVIGKDAGTITAKGMLTMPRSYIYSTNLFNIADNKAITSLEGTSQYGLSVLDTDNAVLLDNSGKEVTEWKIATVENNPLVFLDSAHLDQAASVTGANWDYNDYMTGLVYGGKKPYKFEATGLPDGITLQNNWPHIKLAGTFTTVSDPGTITITVTDANGATASIDVAYGAVTPKNPVTGVELDKDEISVNIDEIATLNATVSPAEATIADVNWAISGEAATVKGGTITGKSAGVATVTVKTVQGGFTDTCTVYVKEKQPTASQDDTYITGLVKNAKYTIDGTEYLADEDGMIAIDPTWRLQTLEIVRVNEESKCNSDVQKLTIAAKPLKDSWVTLGEYNSLYDGTAKEPEVTVKDGETVLVKDTDYTVVYTNNVDAGTATVTVEGIGKYSGTVEKTFEINGINIATSTITLSQNEYTYDGTQHKPGVTVEMGETLLEEGKDYEVVYGENINAGNGYVTVEGKGLYEGKNSKVFIIKKVSIEGKTIVLDGDSFAYTGSEIKPDVTIEGLTEGTDFEVYYFENKNAGTATVRVEGRHNYNGYIETTFTITPCTHTWDGGTVTTAATCTTTGVKTYTCTIPGCGETKTETIAKAAHSYSSTYTVDKKATTSADGSKSKHCTRCDAKSSVTAIPKISSIKLSATSYVYNGKVNTPSVIVKDRTGKTLVKNDYTVSYASGIKYVGKYAVKVTFKGKYSGTKNLYFYVKPKSTSIASLSERSKGFYVKWNKQATQTTGYQIQYSTSSKFTNPKSVTISKNSTTSKTISKLTGKKKYYVRVRTYKNVKINGKATKIYSSWSKVKYVTTKA